WLLWFLACLDRAFDGADAILAAVMRKARFWTQLASQDLNPRQRGMLNRLLEGFEGKLTTSKWAALAKTSQDTALRDIEDLMRLRLLVRESAGGRSTSYALLSSLGDALRRLAGDLRERKQVFVHGPEMLMPQALEARVAATIEVARALDGLADEAESRPVTYAALREQLELLQGLGAWPRTDLVSAAATWLVRAAASPIEANAVPAVVLETGALDPEA
ncbi:MAG: hypothetical protein KGO51_01315, partial [Alphaproteobacteria bacterium]|nr:hypothetical protein [Alphaproteobacteria bacterium]